MRLTTLFSVREAGASSSDISGCQQYSCKCSRLKCESNSVLFSDATDIFRIKTKYYIRWYGRISPRWKIPVAVKSDIRVPVVFIPYYLPMASPLLFLLVCDEGIKFVTKVNDATFQYRKE